MVALTACRLTRMSWVLGPAQEHKRAVRRVNVSVVIVLLLLGHESLLVTSMLQTGEPMLNYAV